jgi:hypothetical protein
MGEILKLNVGGHQTQIYKSTLAQLDYFKIKLERWSNLNDRSNLNDNDKDNNNKDSGEELFVDYDYKLFKHLLNKLRNPSYVMPNNKNIRTMCDYFGCTIQKQVRPIKQIYSIKYSGTRCIKTLKIKDDTKILDMSYCNDDDDDNDLIFKFLSNNKEFLIIDTSKFSTFFYAKDHGNQYGQEFHLCENVIKSLRKIKKFEIHIIINEPAEVTFINEKY